MTDIYSDEEITEYSSYDSSDEIVYKEETEYFSKDENIILKQILNFHGESNHIVKKNNDTIKLDIFRSILSGSNNYNKGNCNHYHFSINISIVDFEDNQLKKNDYLKPIIYINSILSPKKDFLDELNIKLSMVTAVLTNDNKIKLYLGHSNERCTLDSIVLKNGNKDHMRFEKFLNSIDHSKEKLSSINSINMMYIEIFYYSFLLIENKINTIKEIDNEINEEEDIFGIYNIYKKFDKSTIDYEILCQKLNLINDTEKKLIDIPKNLINTKKQIIEMLINQLKVVNENKGYKHYIDYINLYKFEFNIITSNNVNIKLMVDIDPILYPFKPPVINIISPKVNLLLSASISKLDILKIENWNPTISLEWLITNLAINLNNIEEYISDDVSEIDRYIIELAILNGETINFIKFNLDYNKYKINDKSDDDKYWTKGVGYGYSGRNNWDIKEYIKNLQNQQLLISNKIDIINDEFLGIINEDSNTTDRNKNFINTKFTGFSELLINYIFNSINNTTMLEINKSVDLYKNIIKIIPNIFIIMGDNEIYNQWKIKLSKSIKNIVDDISIILETIEDSSKLSMYVTFISLYDTIKEECTNLELIVSNLEKIDSKDNTSTDKFDKVSKEYTDMVSQCQSDMFNNYEFNNKHRFFDNIKSKDNISKNTRRILMELSSLKKNLPNNWDTSVILRTSQKNINLLTFIITGPKDTPYHNGIYEFHGYLPHDYPEKEPKILLDTTGNGKVRFNPNLYNCGKVCLSLLGTWNGTEAEKWNSSTSSLLQVIVSIQSLILVQNPYYNEPGWERQMKTIEGRKKSFSYTDRIRIANLRWAIIDKLKNPTEGFEDFIYNHFNYKKKEILNVIKDWLEETEQRNEMLELKNEFIKLLKNKKDNLTESEKEESKKEVQELENSEYDCKLSLSESINDDSDMSTDKNITYKSEDEKKDLKVFQFNPNTPPHSPPTTPPYSPHSPPTTPPYSPPIYENVETQTSFITYTNNTDVTNISSEDTIDL